MQSVIRPTQVALAMSRAMGGTCIPQPMTSLRWIPCPDCAKYMGNRMTACRLCDGLGRLAAWPA
jgi:hypothetical protein